jgi:benzoate-CoA ligase family protein
VTFPEPPEQFNLADYFLAVGAGDQAAVVTDERTYSYDEVRERVNQAANLLHGLGLQPEQRVLLAFPDGMEYVCALFGILKAGGVVVMANPALSSDELGYLRQMTRARVCLLHAAPAPVELAFPQSVVTLDQFAQELPAQSSAFPTFPTHRDDAAIWLFSGGTTGRPKAAVQSHRSFFNTTELYGKRFMNYTAADRTIAVPKLFFGYATGSNLFFPFSVGASTVLFAEKPTPDVLFEKIRRHRPTVLINVPTVVNHMVAHPQARHADLSSLRVATSAGEPLPESLFSQWNDTFGVELLDGLGTAEMWHIFLSNPPGGARPGTLGVPVPGFEVRVCDEEGRELPRGEVGHLWVAGQSRATCYWQDAPKSARAFRGDYFVSSDLVSQDEHGYFSYCGRGDELLKVAGRWLAPQQVESCLLTHPAVKECAVVGLEGSDGLVRPYAYVVPAAPHDGLEQVLKEHVLAALDPYKHPRRVLFVDDLPRTHLGKVDRGALRRRPLP